MTRPGTGVHPPCGSPPVFGARRTSGAMRFSRSSQAASRSSFFFLPILRPPCQAVEECQVGFIVDLGCLGLCYHRLCLDICTRDWLLAFPSPPFLLLLLNLFVCPLVKGITGVSVELFIEVVLIGGERFLTFPLHVLNHSSKPSFNLPFVLRRLVNVPDRTCYKPMTSLMDISRNTGLSTCWIPVVFAIRFWGKLCPLRC